MPIACSQLTVVGLVASLVLSTALPAVAASADKPEDFVRRVYGRFRANGPGVSTERPGGSAFYTAALLDAFAEDVALAHGEVGTIDGDPLCDCQDYNLRLKSVTIEAGEPDTVKARVAFNNLGSPRTMILTLSHTQAGWRIADVADKDMKSLVALLQDARTHPIAPAPSHGTEPPKP